MKRFVLGILAASALMPFVANAGLFGTYSPYCGLSLERVDNQLMLTFTQNRLRPGHVCDIDGDQAVLTCRSAGTCTNANASSNDVRSVIFVRGGRALVNGVMYLPVRADLSCGH